MLRGCGHRAYAIGAFLPLLHTVTILQECHTPSFVKISQIRETCRETQFAITQNFATICSNHAARQLNHAVHPSKWTMRGILLMA